MSNVSFNSIKIHLHNKLLTLLEYCPMHVFNNKKKVSMIWVQWMKKVHIFLCCCLNYMTAFIRSFLFLFYLNRLWPNNFGTYITVTFVGMSRNQFERIKRAKKGLTLIKSLTVNDLIIYFLNNINKIRKQFYNLNFTCLDQVQRHSYTCYIILYNDDESSYYYWIFLKHNF